MILKILKRLSGILPDVKKDDFFPLTLMFDQLLRKNAHKEIDLIQKKIDIYPC